MSEEKKEEADYDKNINEDNGCCVEVEIEELDEPEDYSDVELPEDDDDE